MRKLAAKSRKRWPATAVEAPGVLPPKADEKAVAKA
jgi:hypothetical protein